MHGNAQTFVFNTAHCVSIFATGLRQEPRVHLHGWFSGAGGGWQADLVEHHSDLLQLHRLWRRARMRNTRGVSSFNDLNTDNTRILECIYCILLYFIHGTPVFSILGDGTTMEHVVEYNAIALEVFQRVTANTRPVKRKIA